MEKETKMYDHTMWIMTIVLYAVSAIWYEWAHQIPSGWVIFSS